MALAPRIEIRQSQTLVMTPQLQQAIKLLQLSNLELAEYIAAEVEKNPLLELAPPPAPSGPGGTSSRGAITTAAISTRSPRRSRSTITCMPRSGRCARRPRRSRRR